MLMAPFYLGWGSLRWVRLLGLRARHHQSSLAEVATLYAGKVILWVWTLDRSVAGRQLLVMGERPQALELRLQYGYRRHPDRPPGGTNRLVRIKLSWWPRSARSPAIHLLKQACRMRRPIRASTDGF